jgi:hypothetical protein
VLSFRSGSVINLAALLSSPEEDGDWKFVDLFGTSSRIVVVE